MFERVCLLKVFLLISFCLCYEFVMILQLMDWEFDRVACRFQVRIGEEWVLQRLRRRDSLRRVKGEHFVNEVEPLRSKGFVDLLSFFNVLKKVIFI